MRTSVSSSLILVYRGLMNCAMLAEEIFGLSQKTTGSYLATGTLLGYLLEKEIVGGGDAIKRQVDFMIRLLSTRKNGLESIVLAQLVYKAGTAVLLSSILSYNEIFDVLLDALFRCMNLDNEDQAVIGIWCVRALGVLVNVSGAKILLGRRAVRVVASRMLDQDGERSALYYTCVTQFMLIIVGNVAWAKTVVTKDKLDRLCQYEGARIPRMKDVYESLGYFSPLIGEIKELKNEHEWIVLIAGENQADEGALSGVFVSLKGLV
jgi:hypothetical protein